MDKEKYQLKQQQKLEVKEKERKKQNFKKTTKNVVIVLIIGAAVFGGYWFLTSQADQTEPGKKSDIIAKNGLHWHANLSIKILGNSADIPAGIGLERLPHQSLHTHDRDNVIHLEFSELVREEDLRLGRFFDIWGKTFNENCIFENCSGEQGQLKMLVNNQENLEFDNYIMKDGDKIEIIFE